jgi:hypothetical protein
VRGDAAPRAGVSSAAPRQRTIAAGDAIPQLSSRRLDAPGRTLVIPSGNAMILAFLATWSEPDKKAIPKLQAIHAKYAGRGLVVVDVAIDDEADHVLEFARGVVRFIHRGYHDGDAEEIEREAASLLR